MHLNFNLQRNIYGAICHGGVYGVRQHMRKLGIVIYSHAVVEEMNCAAQTMRRQSQ